MGWCGPYTRAVEQFDQDRENCPAPSTATNIHFTFGHMLLWARNAWAIIVRMVRYLIGGTIAWLLCSLGCAQQVPDSAFSFASASPAYPPGQGPLVVLDEAHNNFHTLDGRYFTFGKVLAQDGYVMQAGTEKFTAAYLARTRILVISNALAQGDTWRLPTRSAFTHEEIEAVEQWVNDGGSLLLIADHMPFGGAAAELGRAFGFDWMNGYAMRKQSGLEIFSRRSGNLTANPITDGRDPAEHIDSIALFTGSAFVAPPQAVPIMLLNDDYEILFPKRAGKFKKAGTKEGHGMVNGAMLEHGKGRLVACGEAAMLSAQLLGSERAPMGMNQRGAEQNPQFLLNVIHWLDTGR